MLRFMVLFLALLGLASAQTAPGDAVVATVGGKNITKAYFDMQYDLFVRGTLRQQGQEYNPENVAQFDSMKPQFLERIARDEAVLQASRAAGFSASEDKIQAAIDEAKGQFQSEEELNKALAEAGIKDLDTYRALVDEALTYNAYIEYLQNKIALSNPALKLIYLINKNQFRVDTRYCSAHILVDSEAKAKEIIAQLDKGAKFADLAIKNSTDPGSKDQGGELGCEPKGTFVAPFETAIAKLKAGQYTHTPVKTEFGYHVILLSKIEPAGFQSFEEVKGNLEGGLRDSAVQKLIERLVERSQIQTFPEAIGVKAGG